MTEKDTVKKTLIFPRKLDNLLRVQSAIHNTSQGQEIVNILTRAIEPQIIKLLEAEQQFAEPAAIAASEHDPHKDKKNKK